MRETSKSLAKGLKCGHRPQGHRVALAVDVDEATAEVDDPRVVRAILRRRPVVRGGEVCKNSFRDSSFKYICVIGSSKTIIIVH